MEGRGRMERRGRGFPIGGACQKRVSEPGGSGPVGGGAWRGAESVRGGPTRGAGHLKGGGRGRVLTGAGPARGRPVGGAGPLEGAGPGGKAGLTVAAAGPQGRGRAVAVEASCLPRRPLLARSAVPRASAAGSGRPRSAGVVSGRGHGTGRVSGAAGPAALTAVWVASGLCLRARLLARGRAAVILGRPVSSRSAHVRRGRGCVLLQAADTVRRVGRACCVCCPFGARQGFRHCGHVSPKAGWTCALLLREPSTHWVWGLLCARLWSGL